MRSLVYILLICVAGSCFGGCAEDSSPTKPTTPVVVVSDTVVTITVSAFRFFPPRSGEYYLVWFRYHSDSLWHLTDTMNIKYIFSDGHATNLNHNIIPHSADTLLDVLVSLERSLVPAAPTLPILYGKFTRTDTAMVAQITPFNLPDFSALQTNLVFTTGNTQAVSDSEFYLCTFLQTGVSPSLENLPALPAPWKYGLWAIDSNNTPIQRVFYGLFMQPSGHDNDSANDNLPYPGGATKAPMNLPSGSIIVTLEPDWYSEHTLVSLGPTAYSLLEFDRRRMITRDSNYMMTNVSAGALPFGTVIVQKK